MQATIGIQTATEDDLGHFHRCVVVSNVGLDWTSVTAEHRENIRCWKTWVYCHQGDRITSGPVIIGLRCSSLIGYATVWPPAIFGQLAIATISRQRS